MKKVLIGFVVVLVAMEIMSLLVNGVILGSTYASEELKNVWRPDMDAKMWIFQIPMIIGAFFFSFIFSKGYEGKGIMEGVRYGLYIGIWLSVGMAYGTYAMIAIPYKLALQWFIYGVIEYIIYVILVGLVFGTKPKEAAAPQA
jgi:hypothetical protein